MKFVALLLIFLAVDQPLTAVHAASLVTPTEPSQHTPRDVPNLPAELLLSLSANTTNPTGSYNTTAKAHILPWTNSFSLTDPAKSVLVISSSVLLLADLFKFMMTIVRVVAKLRSSNPKNEAQKNAARTRAWGQIAAELMALAWTVIATVPVLYSHVTTESRMIQVDEAMKISVGVFLGIRLLWLIAMSMIYSNFVFNTGKSKVLGGQAKTAAKVGAFVVAGIPMAKKAQTVGTTKTGKVASGDVFARIHQFLNILAIISCLSAIGGLITVAARTCKVAGVNNTADSKFSIPLQCENGKTLPNFESCLIACNSGVFNGTQPSCLNGMFDSGVLSCSV